MLPAAGGKAVFALILRQSEHELAWDRHHSNPSVSFDGQKPGPPKGERVLCVCVCVHRTTDWSVLVQLSQAAGHNFMKRFYHNTIHLFSFFFLLLRENSITQFQVLMHLVAVWWKLVKTSVTCWLYKKKILPGWFHFSRGLKHVCSPAISCLEYDIFAIGKFWPFPVAGSIHFSNSLGHQTFESIVWFAGSGSNATTPFPNRPNGQL